MSHEAQSELDVARTFLESPRASTNVRVASWIFTVVFNFIWISNLAAALASPDLSGRQVARAALALGALVFGSVIVWLSVRFVRVAVMVDGRNVVIRNLFRTYVVNLSDVDRFEFGFPDAKLPGGNHSGSALMTNGDRISTMAISDGVVGAKRPESSQIIVNSLNQLVGDAHQTSRRPSDAPKDLPE